VADAPDRQELLTALTTEHFTLVSLALLHRHADRLLEERAGRTEALFPSPRAATDD
jgi:hypothetical protein